ncbi:MAG TPA: heparan-alpha-glucosaminide N-acetyltransferase domain-containing protein [Saprospiraceae bacterium]|nr:heparan-alpha-glucosaminide N-acetyltransferase domain-containing protein [Saprospiraceae bacterium]
MTAQPANRLIFLDAMRGFTIAAMILVNFPGNEEYVFSPLRHTVWNGLTPTDLIAPFFLFIVGISIVLSYGKRLEKGDSKGDLYKKIFWRFVKIYALGISLNLLPDFDFSELRYTGVLPRIALVFLPCAFIFLNTSFRQQVWIGVLILVAYWLAMTLIPTPGVGKVMLDPGVNLAAWVDSKYLPGRMWQGTWDPEGILSTFPAIVTGITGLLAGHLLISKRTPTDKVIYLMIFGLISGVAGYVWGLTFPVNENLWTSSFVLVTSGMAAMILGATYYVVDIRGFTGWVNPGIIFGANAIGVYVLADLLALIFYVFPMGSATLNIHLTEAMTNFGIPPRLSSCCYALFFLCVNFIPAYFLYKKKIFIKV